jgi:chorismate mutase
MFTRGIRGATTINKNLESAILEGTAELLNAIMHSNPTVSLENIAFALFTVTPEITAAYPAKAARQLGWKTVPLMCAQEIPVDGSLPMCIRVLITCNTTMTQEDINHVYLRQAVALRPDLAFD